MTRVLLMGDRPVLLAGLRSHLAEEGPFDVAGSTTPGRRGREAALELHPDVILIDCAAGACGFLVCHQLKQLARPQRVVLHVVHATPQLQVAAWVAGADGLASTATPASQLSRIIRSAAAGRRTLPRPSIAAVQAAGRRLEPIDVPIFGMRMHDVPSNEISGALRLDPLEVDGRVRSLVERMARDQGPRSERDGTLPGRAGRGDRMDSEHRFLGLAAAGDSVTSRRQTGER